MPGVAGRSMLTHARPAVTVVAVRTTARRRVAVTCNEPEIEARYCTLRRCAETRVLVIANAGKPPSGGPTLRMRLVSELATRTLPSDPRANAIALLAVHFGARPSPAKIPVPAPVIAWRA